MEENIVTKTQLARELKVSAPMVTKYVRLRILDKCFVPDTMYKKLYLDKCLEAISRYKTRGDSHLRKEPPPKKHKTNKEVEKLIEKSTSKTVKKSEDMYTDKNLEELKEFLADIDSPKQKVDAIDVFWRGRINKIKHDQLKRELIPLDEAKYIIEKILSPINRHLDDLPSAIMSRFPNVDPLMLEWLSLENDRAKGKLGDIK